MQYESVSPLASMSGPPRTRTTKADHEREGRGCLSLLLFERLVPFSLQPGEWHVRRRISAWASGSFFFCPKVDGRLLVEVLPDVGLVERHPCHVLGFR